MRAILGRPPSPAGSVVHGFERGRTLGFPTANIEVETGTIFPGRGVYAARALVDGRWYRAAVNVGHNPTFHYRGDETGIVHVEAFLLGFDGDIYGHCDPARLPAQDPRRAALRVRRRPGRPDAARHRVPRRLADPAFAEVGL